MHRIYYGTAKKKGQGATPEQDGEEGDHYRFLKGYAVFNADQVEGLPERYHPAQQEIDTGARPDEALDDFFGRMPFRITGGFDHAAYRGGSDEIVMPDVSRFESTGAYYATICHEATHATGIATRLDRECFARYHTDREERAAEELIAEIGSMMLTAQLGVAGEHIDNHAAYVASWLK